MKRIWVTPSRILDVIVDLLISLDIITREHFSYINHLTVSDFQVRGVSGLRVVDASVYPRIPGTFTALSTFLVAEKAADVILEAAKASH
jgi:hypothetical protein